MLFYIIGKFIKWLILLHDSPSKKVSLSYLEYDSGIRNIAATFTFQFKKTVKIRINLLHHFFLIPVAKLLQIQEEMTDVVFILEECCRNCLMASQMYGERYPCRAHPDPHAWIE